MAFSGVGISSTRNGITPITGYRDDLATADTVVCSLTSTLGISTFKWQMVGRPEGSTAGGAGPEPVLLGTSATCTFTVDDDSTLRRDGSYLVRCTVNAGTSTETEIQVILARLSGLSLAGGRTLRKPAAFETLGLDTSVANTNEGWAIQFLRWLEYVRTQAGGSGANTNLTFITKANETGSAPNSIGLSTLGGPGLLKFASDGTPSKAAAGTDYQAPLSAANGTIVFPTSTTVKVGTLPNAFIVQGTADATLSGAQFLGALATGLVKNTATTGVLSIAAANTDYPSVSATYLVASATNAPPSAVNLGLLTTGLLKISVSGAVATPSTAAAGTDYQLPISAADASIVLPTATTITRGALTGDATAPQGSNTTKVVAVHETSGPTQLTLGSVPDGEFLQRSGTSLIGTNVPASATTGIVANWPLTTVRTFLYDPVNGNDANPGFSDGAGPYNPATQAKATEAGLASIFPSKFAGRKFRIIYAAGTYSTSWIGDLLSGIDGYGSALVRPTATNATASATAFADDANDRVFWGFTTATNAFASGYNPTGTPTTTQIQLVKVGGGSPSFPGEPASPLGYRIRGDNSSGTTTQSALRNATATIIQIIGSDTVVLDAALPAVPTATDTFYVEMPGTVFSSATAIAGIGSGTGFLEVGGARFTSGLSIIGPGRIGFVGTGAQTLSTSSSDAIAALPSASDPTGGAVTIGGGVRVEGTTSVNNSLGNPLFVSSVFAGTFSFLGKPITPSFNACVFGAGLDVLTPLSLSTRLFVGTRSRIIGPESAGAGILFNGSGALLGAVDITFSAPAPRGILFSPNIGSDSTLIVESTLTGTLTGSGWGIGFFGSVNTALVVASKPTITGTLGDIVLADGATTVTWTQAAVSSYVDSGNNKIVPTPADTWPIQATPAGMALVGGSLTVPSLVGPGHLRVNSGGLFSVDTAAYLADPGGNGIVVRTASGVTTNRTLASGGTITVTNGSGVSGNPSVDLPNVGPGAGLIGGSGIASISLDAQGRVTAAATATYLTTISGVTAGGDLTGTYPNPTIALNAVTGAKFRTSVALSVVGNSTNATANVADIVATGAGQVLQDMGTSLAWAPLAYSSVTGTPTLFYQTVQANGTPLAQQPVLNFDGTVVALPGSGKTTVGLPTQGGLTAGSYTSANITVDAYGRVTAAGNGGGAGAPASATYILQTPNGGLSSAQALSALATGILKSTTTTGVVSIAAGGTDYEFPLTFNTGLTRSTNTVTWTNAAATYLVAGSVGAPTNAINLGALASGFVKSSVSGGLATISIDTSTYLTTTAAAATYMPLLALTNRSVPVSGGGSSVVEDNANFQYNTSSHALTLNHLVLTGSDGSTTAINLNQAGQQSIFKVSGTFVVGTADANQLILATNDAAALTIASSGGVTLASLGSGIVKATSGLLSIATAGTDYLTPATAFYQTVQSVGSPLTQRSKLNFGTAFVVSDNPSFGSTDVSMAVGTADLGGSYPASTVVAVHEGGGTQLALGSITDGVTTDTMLVRAAGTTNIVGRTIASQQKTRMYFSLDFTAGSFTSATWLFFGQGLSQNIGHVIEYPNDFKATQIQVVANLTVNTMASGSTTFFATRLGSGIAGTGITITPSTPTGLITGTLLPTGSGAATDQYGFALTGSGTSGGLTIAFEVVLIP